MTKDEADKMYVAPHTLKSRPCTEEDIDKILELAPTMAGLCHIGRGMYPAGFAIVHAQLDDKDPMAFFVNSIGDIFINPKITNHTKYLIPKKESCLSFPNMAPTTVLRPNVVEGEFTLLNLETKKFAGVKKFKLKGIEAQVMCHEIDHLEGKYIYQLN